MKVRTFRDVGTLPVSTCRVCGCEITGFPRRCFDCRRKPPQFPKWETLNLKTLLAVLFVISLWCVLIQKIMADHVAVRNHWGLRP